MKSPGQALVRRAALQAVGGLDPEIWGSDDWDLWMRLAARGPVAVTNRCALYYRLHATNASHQAERMFWSGVQVIRKNLALVAAAKRSEARARALQDLYLYSGTRVVNAARGGSWKARVAALKVLTYLAVYAVRDWTFCKTLGRDLVPASLRRASWRARSAEANRVPSA